MESKSVKMTALPAADEVEVVGASHQAWEAPKVRRIETSSAELGAGDTVDLEGMS